MVLLELADLLLSVNTFGIPLGQIDCKHRMYACGKEHLKGYFSLVRKSSFTYTSELGLYLSITKGTTAAQIIQTDLTEIVS